MSVRRAFIIISGVNLSIVGSNIETSVILVGLQDIITLFENNKFLPVVAYESY